MWQSWVAIVACSVGAAYLISEDRQTESHLIYTPESSAGDQLCGVSAIVTICRLNGLNPDPLEVIQRSGYIPKTNSDSGVKGISVESLVTTLSSYGISYVPRTADIDEVPCDEPVIAILNADEGLFHSVVAVFKPERILLIDGGDVRSCSPDYFRAVSAGVVLTPMPKDL